jgi:phosphoesterase RecJ-like protein
MNVKEPMTPQVPQGLIEALRRAKRVALITHVNPDGDGLGAQAALAEALEGMGKQVVIANQDLPQPRYDFLNLQRRYGQAGACDLALVMDTSVLSRIGSAAEALKQAAEVGVIDHHAGSDASFAKHAWVVATAASTGSLVAELLETLQVPLTPTMAGAIYAALAHDTGCFRYSNTSAECFALAAKLKAAGADTAAINVELFESKPAPALMLWAKALSGLEIGDGGLSAIAVVSQAMMDACGAKAEDSDGIVEAARAIQGVEVAAMLRVDKAGVKLSTRSKKWLDVNALCAKFGGGGHHRASGATMAMGLDEAKAAVKAAISEAVNDRSAVSR